MSTFSLNHLDQVEFEEFCYDLLSELGFVNLNWRKGTGLPSSPSDSGRDIECQFERKDVDKRIRLEKWFVECKHYEKGVPPEKLQGILTWATSSNVDFVLIIVSNHLSNPAKDFLENYEVANKPRYKIKVWERPDLEKLTVDKISLLRKYRIVGDFSFLNIIHPAHALYLREPSFNSINYLFELFDELDAKKRDAVLSGIYPFIAQPRPTYSTTTMLGRDVTVTDSSLDEVSYEIFKQKCYQIASLHFFDQTLLVFLIVNFVLQVNFAISDTTSVDTKQQQNEELTRYWKKRSAENPHDKDRIEHMLETAQKYFKDLPERTSNNYKEYYTYFCESIISQLFLEQIGITQRLTTED